MRVIAKANNDFMKVNEGTIFEIRPVEFHNNEKII